MELGFSLNPTVSPSIQQRRMNRAQWWFEQMRRAVEEAVDWKQMAKNHDELRQTLLTSRN